MCREGLCKAFDTQILRRNAETSHECRRLRWMRQKLPPCSAVPEQAPRQERLIMPAHVRCAIRPGNTENEVPLTLTGQLEGQSSSMKQ